MTDRVYLLTSYAERDSVKALGARYDGERRRWFVPPGMDLAPFTAWLPEDLRARVATTDIDVVRGVSLAQLMSRVSRAVAVAFGGNEWVRVEVIDVKARGHVYLELAERDGTGKVLAQARGVIWSSTADRILPKFERDTGAVLGANLKLLVSARPVFHAQYGLSLQIDDIDPQYTLGDFEARRREIRARLQREGLFDRNRGLPTPWDYCSILVLAPEQAAGLGDFMAEARRLEQAGICRFEILHSRFQGEGAAAEMRQVLIDALATKATTNDTPDALVILRGGGAVSDLAWLDDYALARCLCEMEMPVLTGIGHERDNTILDEVAHTRFDTPSKVIVGIEKVIVARVREARQAFETIRTTAAEAAAKWRGHIRQCDAAVREGALRQIDRARTTARDRHDSVQAGARRSLASARDATDEFVGTVRQRARVQLDEARQQVPQWMAEVRAEARQSLRSARQQATSALDAVTDRTRSASDREHERTEGSLLQVAQGSIAAVANARDRSQALMLEIVGQGPEKTLRRGFALVRDEVDHPLTSAAALRSAGQASVQFSDGRVNVVTNRDQDPT